MHVADRRAACIQLIYRVPSIAAAHWPAAWSEGRVRLKTVTEIGHVGSLSGGRVGPLHPRGGSQRKCRQNPEGAKETM
jgi:hypothetical protein